MSDHGHALARDFSFSATSDLRTFLTARDLERDHGGDVFGWARKLGVEAGGVLGFSAPGNAGSNPGRCSWAAALRNLFISFVAPCGRARPWSFIQHFRSTRTD